MSSLLLGIIAGIVFGLIVVAMMMPMQFPDKRAALLGAFFNRFSIGVVLGAVIGAPRVSALGFSPWLIGLIVGLLLSIADAIITKAYAPIIVIGTVGGGIIGLLIGRFGR